MGQDIGWARQKVLILSFKKSSLRPIDRAQEPCKVMEEGGGELQPPSQSRNFPYGKIKDRWRKPILGKGKSLRFESP